MSPDYFEWYSSSTYYSNVFVVCGSAFSGYLDFVNSNGEYGGVRPEISLSIS